MALRKAFAQRLSNIYRIASPSLTSCRITSSPAATAATTKASGPPEHHSIAPDPGDGGVFRRFLHGPPFQPEIRSLPMGQSLIQILRGMDISRQRIRLDGLLPPVEMRLEPKPEPEPEEGGKVTVEDAKKLLRLAQLETVKERLRQIEKSCISHDEFVEVCRDGCWSREEAKRFAKTLDESGNVIVIGNVVFLRPEQVVKAIQGLIPPVPSPYHPSDPRLRELEAMEEQKAAIDKKADSMVRRELWGGLGFFVIQTAAFMRLTFWELSWDVMEPICFYVTSIYCMAGYAFFLRTSKEPSFEGFFQSRFSSKQKRLMKIHKFDLQRYNELRRAFDPHLHHATAFDATSLTVANNHDTRTAPSFQDTHELKML